MKSWIYGGAALVVAFVLYRLMFAGTQGGAEVEFRYEPVQVGELVLSTSSVGTLVPLTTVDVRSRAGGEVVQLVVDEGSRVRAGDLIALIDPRDNQASFDQASADVESADARVQQAVTNAELQERNSQTSVRNAEVALELAQIRLARAEKDAETQPVLSRAELAGAQAALQAQERALDKLQQVDIPQRRRDAQLAADRASADLAAAQAEMERQRRLFERGYTSKANLDRAVSALAAARQSTGVAQQRLDTLEDDFAADLASQQARVSQARAALDQAQANQARIVISQKALEEARKAVTQAEIDLSQTKNERLTIQTRRLDATAAKSSAVRSRVARANALVQLESTRVVAPRDGVVTTKYIEQGTVIPPGTSVFAQGTSIVQIADTTRMFVECQVDEADIANVRVGQQTRIVVEAYPGRVLRGVVESIAPSATNNGGINTVKVRVAVGEEQPSGPPGPGVGAPGGPRSTPPMGTGPGMGGPGGMMGLRRAPTTDPIDLRPGMGANVEFLLLERSNVLVLPQVALRRDGDTTYVLVKSADPLKPERRVVEVGASGNTGIEILEGLEEGEEVVVAEIDLRALRERQEKMLQLEQGGGFGAAQQKGPSRPRGQ